MYHAAQTPQVASSTPELQTSLDASDEYNEASGAACYCPHELLGNFALLMAGHGRTVSSAMMLGDRGYAMWQLARAQAMADEQLRALAVKLFGYFDEAR